MESAVVEIETNTLVVQIDATARLPHLRGEQRVVDFVFRRNDEDILRTELKKVAYSGQE